MQLKSSTEPIIAYRGRKGVMWRSVWVWLNTQIPWQPMQGINTAALIGGAKYKSPLPWQELTWGWGCWWRSGWWSRDVKDIRQQLINTWCHVFPVLVGCRYPDVSLATPPPIHPPTRPPVSRLTRSPCYMYCIHVIVARAFVLLFLFTCPSPGSHFAGSTLLYKTTWPLSLNTRPAMLS